MKMSNNNNALYIDKERGFKLILPYNSPISKMKKEKISVLHSQQMVFL